MVFALLGFSFVSCSNEKLLPLEKFNPNEAVPLTTLKSDFCTLDGDAVK